MLLDLFKSVVGLRSKTTVAPWASSPEAFESYFQVNYEEFAQLVDNLDQARADLYEKTLEVNPEAAVTWVFWVSGDRN
jgi:hypothetical protein